ncbi:MAG: GlsB/YeaQ/YmgE family stress response membrane protein [Dehalococcoidia bacterium]
MIGAIIIWLVIGLIAGALANMVMHSGHGIVIDIVLGLVGAIVGGFIARVLFGYGTSSFIGHIIIAFIGAVIVIGVVRMVEGRRVAG